jgi:hypothetical protein
VSLPPVVAWSAAELEHARALKTEGWNAASIAAELREKYGQQRTTQAVRSYLFKTKGLSAEQIERSRKLAEVQQTAKQRAAAKAEAARFQPPTLPRGHQVRRCLGNDSWGLPCAREFVSTWSGNRLCATCKGGL